MTTSEISHVNKRLDKIEPVLEEHKDTLLVMKPLVDSHELILHGAKDDWRDEGMVGVLNSIEKTNKVIQKWATAVGVAIVISAITFATSQVWGMYVSWLMQQSLNP